MFWEKVEEERTGKGEEATVFDLKAIVFNILRRLGISARSLDSRQEADDIFAAKLSVATRSGKQLAEIGILKSCLLRRFEIEQPVAYASIDWDVKYAPLPKTQPVKRDLAILVDKAVSFAQIEETVRKSERKLLGEVWLFDVYEGKNLPEGKKSYAISMTLQDPEKTLNDKQIEAVMKKVTANLQREFGAELR